MIQCPSYFLNLPVYKQHTKKPVSSDPNESDVDQAPVQHHTELLVIIINSWKPSTVMTNSSTLNTSAILCTTP